MSGPSFWISTNAFITLSLRGTVMTSCSSATTPTYFVLFDFLVLLQTLYPFNQTTQASLMYRLGVEKTGNMSGKTDAIKALLK